MTVFSLKKKVKEKKDKRIEEKYILL